MDIRCKVNVLIVLIVAHVLLINDFVWAEIEMHNAQKMLSPALVINSLEFYSQMNLHFPLQHKKNTKIKEMTVIVKGIGFCSESEEHRFLISKQKHFEDVISLADSGEIEISYIIIPDYIKHIFHTKISEMATKKLKEEDNKWQEKVLFVPARGGQPDLDFAETLLAEMFSPEYTKTNLKQIIDLHKKLTPQEKRERNKILLDSLTLIEEADNLRYEPSYASHLYFDKLFIRECQLLEEIRLLSLEADDVAFWHGLPYSKLAEKLNANKLTIRTKFNGKYFASHIQIAADYHSRVILSFNKNIVGEQFAWNGILKSEEDVFFEGALKEIIFEDEVDYGKFKQNIALGEVRIPNGVQIKMRKGSQVYVPVLDLVKRKTAFNFFSGKFLMHLRQFKIRKFFYGTNTRFINTSI